VAAQTQPSEGTPEASGKVIPMVEGPAPVDGSDGGEEAGKPPVRARYAEPIRFGVTLSPSGRNVWTAVVEELVAAGVVDVGDMPSKSRIFRHVLQALVGKDGALRSIDWKRIAAELATEGDPEQPAKPPRGRRKAGP
jgi:hypothetical protein